MKEPILLTYDQNVWEEKQTTPVNTLQVFITNKCNLRCQGCFNVNNLGSNEMSFEDYKELVSEHTDTVKKVIILGGEPTLYPRLKDAIHLNNSLGLNTTIYSNGHKLQSLSDVDLSKTTIRIGVYGFKSSEKPLTNIKWTDLPIDIVYMLNQDNLKEFFGAVKYIEEDLGLKKLYISSIRDILTTGDFWKDTEFTISPIEYAGFVQMFINSYQGNLEEVHISRRGTITTANTLSNPNKQIKCRFSNYFIDGRKIICPFDISKNLTTNNDFSFNTRKCNKHSECLLQKIVLKRI